MQLDLEQREGFWLAGTNGPLTGDASEPFREHLHTIVGQRGAKLVVDLSRSERVNSDGLAQLVRLVSDANTHSSRVVFAAPTPFVANVLSITKLDTFFQVVPTLDEAVRIISVP